MTECAPVDNKAAINCYIKHLKKKNQLEANFIEYAVEFNSSLCKEFVSEVRKELYRNLETKMKDEYNLGNAMKCIRNDLRAHHFAEQSMKFLVYEDTQTMPSDEKQRKVTEIRVQLEKTSKQIIMTCLYARAFGRIFDGIFMLPSSGEDSEDPRKQYCTRQLVIDKKLLDTKMYIVSLNPRNLNLLSFDCCDILANVKSDFRQILQRMLKRNPFEFDKNEQDCIAEKFRQAGIIDRMMLLGVLHRLNISEDKKALEKIVFVDEAVQASFTLSVCSEK